MSGKTVTVNGTGDSNRFQGVFDGQGYTLSNMVVKAKCKAMREFYVGWGNSNNSPQGLGFVRSNFGIIRNLNFEDCQFSIIRKSTSVNNYAMHFGVIAAENNYGKISNCDVINCQAKYVGRSDDAHMSLTVGTNGDGKMEDVNIINDKELDKSFYTDDDLSWKKIGGN